MAASFMKKTMAYLGLVDDDYDDYDDYESRTSPVRRPGADSGPSTWTTSRSRRWRHDQPAYPDPRP